MYLTNYTIQKQNLYILLYFPSIFQLYLFVHPVCRGSKYRSWTNYKPMKPLRAQQKNNSVAERGWHARLQIKWEQSVESARSIREFYRDTNRTASSLYVPACRKNIENISISRVLSPRLSKIVAVRSMQFTG